MSKSEQLAPPASESVELGSLVIYLFINLRMERVLTRYVSRSLSIPFYVLISLLY